jgi:hypothetical protein
VYDGGTSMRGVVLPAGVAYLGVGVPSRTEVLAVAG